MQPFLGESPKFNIVIRLRSFIMPEFDLNSSKAIWFNKGLLLEDEDHYGLSFTAADSSEFLTGFPENTDFNVLVRIPKDEVAAIVYRDTPMDPVEWEQYAALLEGPTPEP